MFLFEKITENIGKKGAQQKKGAQIPLPSSLMSTIESCKPFIENKEEIPDQLIIPLIKGKIMHIKAIEKEKEANRVNKND